MNSFYFDKMHKKLCFIIKKIMCEVVSKNIAFKKTPFISKKNIVFQHEHFFIPLFWNQKLSLYIPYIYYAYIHVFRIFYKKYPF